MYKLLSFTILSGLFFISCSYKQISPKNKFIIEKKYNYAVSFLNKGLTEPAQNELLSAMELAPDDARLHSALGQVYMINEKYDDAFDSFNRAIKLDSKLTSSYLYKGNCYMMLRQWDNAIAQYKKVMGFPFINSPHNLYNSLGLAYYEKGEYQTAIDKFKKSLEFKLDFPIVHYNLGLTYFQIGSIDSAIEEYNSAIKFLPDYVQAYNQLGLIYLKNKDISRAKEKFNKVIKLAPSSDLASEAEKYLSLLK